MKTILNSLLLLFVISSFLSCNSNSKNTKPDSKIVELTTNYGTMLFALYNETPLHRDNFIKLAQEKAYDSVLFHRVIQNFMIQAGDPESKNALPSDTLGEGDLPYRVKAEFNPKLFHKKGALAAARENNPEKASSGMHFYIVQGKVFNDSTLNRTEVSINQRIAQEFYRDSIDKKPLLEALHMARTNRNREYSSLLSDSILNLAKSEDSFKSYTIPAGQRQVYKGLGGTPFLDQNYTVFGEIIDGIDVLDSIAKVKTGVYDRPLEDVRIKTLRVVQ